MSHSLEELKALQAAMNALPSTDAETEAFMADVDAGKYDDAIAESQSRYPTEKLIAELKSKVGEMRQESDRKAAMAAPSGETPERKPFKWSFCPECRSPRHHHCYGYAETHRYCLDCGQEWHTDLDYLKIARDRIDEAERRAADAEALLREFVRRWVGTGFGKYSHEDLAEQARQLLKP